MSYLFSILFGHTTKEKIFNPTLSVCILEIPNFAIHVIPDMFASRFHWNLAKSFLSEV